jgi:signal peptidase I
MSADPVTRRKVRRRLVGAGLVLLVAAGVASTRTLGQLASVRMYMIPTNSMAPTLVSGDRLEADDAGGVDPARGEIWILYGPKHLFPGGGPLVKRVVGLPGETIEIKDGLVHIDDRPLREPYLVTPPSYTMAPRSLGPGEYFVLGDNRNLSQDSHVWGPAPRASFIGRARARLWPLRRFGGL